MDRICATLKRSAGNESVGEVWVETKAFSVSAPLLDVMDWAEKRVGNIHPKGRLTLNVTLSYLQEP